MALVDILDAIRDDADAEEHRLRRDGEQRREELLSRATARAAEREQELASALDDESEDDARAIRNRAQLEAERLLRVAREEVYEQVLDAVVQRLAEFRQSDSYQTIFRRLLDESRRVLPGAVDLVVDAADEQLACELAPELKVKPGISTWGGMELHAGDERRVLNTFESRLERAGPQLRKTFAELAPLRDP